MSAPLVRDEYGVPMGIDWRRVPGATDIVVPGRVAASVVEVGDVIDVGQRLTVRRVVDDGDVVRLFTFTDGGAELVLERAPGMVVTVVECGAFDR